MPILGQNQPQSPSSEAVSPTKIAETTSYGGENTVDPLRVKLQQKFTQVQNKKGALEIQRYINKNKLTEMKKNILREIFTSLQDIGVDLSKPESISEFLQRLSSQDPQLVQMLESALNILSPNDVLEGESSEEGGNALASRYANLQQRVGA